MAILDEFLTSISGCLRAKDALGLKSWLLVEPPLPDQYFQISQELQISYRDSNHLERHITKLIPENDDGKADEGDVWPGFLAFMKEYLEFWRDVNFEDLLETHSQLSGLVKYVYPRGFLGHKNNLNL
jgi:nuclear mRNA export protein PCID2/THP1